MAEGEGFGLDGVEISLKILGFQYDQPSQNARNRRKRYVLSTPKQLIDHLSTASPSFHLRANDVVNLDWPGVEGVHIADERLRFVARLLDGENMARLCVEFGISRETAYEVFGWYQDCGVAGLTDRNRRP